MLVFQPITKVASS